MFAEIDRLIGQLNPLPRATTTAIFLYVLCSAIGLGLSASGIVKILKPDADAYQYWDTIHYVRLGFDYSCQSFYPLWPQVIQSFANGQVNQGLQVAFALSTGLFLVSLPLTYWVFRQLISKSGLAVTAFLLYVLNPNSVFHSNGYTEGGFSMLAVLVLVALRFPRAPSLNGLLLGSTLLMSLMRPSLFQLTGAAVGAWICVALAGRALSQSAVLQQRPPHPNLKQWGWLTGLISVGAIIGYSVYGVYCLHTTGNFLGPFQAQAEWGRKLGLRPMFLLLPRSLLNDLHGLYFPFILAGLVLCLAYVRLRKIPLRVYIPRHPLSWITLFYPPFAGVVYGLRFGWLVRTGSSALRQYRFPAALDALLTSYPFWFCLLMCMANATIGFLAASDSLYSLARFVFAPPFFFIALGMIADVLDSPTTRRFLTGCLLLSGLGLIHQWYSWGNGGWVG